MAGCRGYVPAVLGDTAPAPDPARRFLRIGALSAGIAVGAGAFGAHALRARLDPRMLEVFETAARYQMYHALAIIAAALVIAWLGGATTNATERDARSRATRLAGRAAWCFVAGTLLFSGSLYALACTGITVLGAITPLGGVAFIAGWVLLAIAVSTQRA